MNRLHKVTVLFFETPATFFVVRETNEDDFNHICDTLTGMEWEFGTNHRVVGEPELGELYVTRCTRDDRYYRVMALELHEEEEVGLGHHTLCEFVDVGARKWIHTERLRVIPTELARYPPLAEECCLGGVVPNGPGGKWKQEAIDRFVEMVESDGDCLMAIEDDNDPEDAPDYPLMVDLLCRYRAFSSDRTSVKLSLVWSNLAGHAPPRRRNSRRHNWPYDSNASREVGNGGGGGGEGRLEG